MNLYFFCSDKNGWLAVKDLLKKSCQRQMQPTREGRILEPDQLTDFKQAQFKAKATSWNKQRIKNGVCTLSQVVSVCSPLDVFS
jgi:hypothetical protein